MQTYRHTKKNFVCTQFNYHFYYYIQYMYSTFTARVRVSSDDELLLCSISAAGTNESNYKDYNKI